MKCAPAPGGERYFDLATGYELIEACRSGDFAIVGVEGFQVVPDGLLARIDLIADFSAMTVAPWKVFQENASVAAKAFLDAIEDRAVLVNFTPFSRTEDAGRVGSTEQLFVVGAGAREYLSATLGLSETPLASMARESLLSGPTLYVVAASGSLFAESVDATRSLVASDPQILRGVEPRLVVARSALAAMKQIRGSLVSANQPSVHAADRFVANEPLLTSHGRFVYGSADKLDEETAARVVGLSEGYPPGVIVVHRGTVDAPRNGVFFALSGFDGDTFIVWWPRLRPVT